MYSEREFFNLRLVLTGLLLSISLIGADGVIEINQARALAGSVTAGDGEGFPVTISEPGSYRLTGSLAVPDAETDGIFITTDDVTIDLNGFEISGVTDCVITTGPLDVTCSSTGAGSGITGPPANPSFPSNIVIKNGTIKGMGRSGIQQVLGRVEGVRAISNGLTGIDLPSIGLNASTTRETKAVVDSVAFRNGGTGINAGIGALVTGNNARFNGQTGIRCDLGSCTIIGNTANANGDTGISSGNSSTTVNNVATGNGGSGISASTGVVRGNTTVSNSMHGMILGEFAGYSGNVITGNSGGTVVGGTELGLNICGLDTTCP